MTGHTKAAPVITTRAVGFDWRRVVMLTIIGLSALFVVRGLAQLTQVPHMLGIDFELYQRATQRWLGGGSFHEPYQLAGPYGIPDGFVVNPPVMYPPVALVAFVPTTLLPAPVWYAIPLIGTAWIVARWRPRLVGWTLIALCAAAVPSIQNLTTGNPVMWVMLTVAVSTLWRPAAALVLLKPSLFPFALFGVRDRGWWVMAAGVAVVSLVMLPMTLDWMHVILNAAGGRAGIFYSIRDVPMLLIPLIAWWTRRRAAPLERAEPLP